MDYNNCNVISTLLKVLEDVYVPNNVKNEAVKRIDEIIRGE